MSHRPLAIVSGLTIGDYLLWNWSLNANHDVLALVSGLTLPPLAIACAWLLVLSAARLLTRSSREGRRARGRKRVATKRPLATAAIDRAPAAPSSSSSQRPSRKIAA